MHHWRRIQFILILFFFVSSLYSQGIRVVPAYLSLKMNERNLSGKFVVTNLKEESQRFRVNTTHWMMNNNYRLVKVPPDDNSLVEWIKFNPKEFTIAAHESRTVRYTIMKPKKELNGEFWGGVEFEPLQQNVVRAESKTDKATASIQVLTTFLVPVFVELGQINRKGSLESIQIYQDSTNYIIGCLVKNLGNAALRLRGHYSIYDEANQEKRKGIFSPVLVLPECQIQHKTLMDGTLPPGKYRIEANFENKSKTVTVEGSGDFIINSYNYPPTEDSSN